MSQVRLTRTPEIDTALSFLRGKYPLMSEAEILKMILSEKYQEKREETSGVNVLDLDNLSDMKDVRKSAHSPRKQKHLLSMAGVFSGAKDISSNKKNYIY